MADIEALLRIALDPGRGDAARLESLAELGGQIHGPGPARVVLDALVAEASAPVREALLVCACTLEPAEVDPPEALGEALASVAVDDPEPDLRVTALDRLAAVAGGTPALDGAVASLFATELDPAVIRAALAALDALARPSTLVLDALGALAATAPGELRAELVAPVAGFAPAHLAALLSPWEAPPVLAAAIEAAGSLAVLPVPVGQALADLVEQGPDDGSAAAAVAVLAGTADLDPAIVLACLDAVGRAPQRLDLAEVARARLAVPGAAARIGGVLAASPSARVRRLALDLLGGSVDPALAVALLADPDPGVRRQAIAACDERTAQGEAVTTPLALRLAGEPSPLLRRRIIAALAGAGRLAPEADDALVARWDAEPDPSARSELAAVLAGVPLSDRHRAILVRAFTEALADPAVPKATVDAVAERCRALASTDDPALVASLTALLARETDIARAEEWWVQLTRLVPDRASLAPLALDLLLRFLQYHPRDPLPALVTLLGEAAATRPEIAARMPEVVALTGSTWASDPSGAEAPAPGSALLDLLVAAIDGGAFMAPQRVIDDAYQARTLTRADLVAAFDLVVGWPGQEAVLQQVADIMAAESVLDLALAERALALVEAEPWGTATDVLTRLLTTAGPPLDGFAALVWSHFDQAHLDGYARLDLGPYDIDRVPATWHDWSWSGWRTMHPDWPVVHLVLDPPLGPPAVAAACEVLARPLPPGRSGVATVHHLVLHHLWREGVADAEVEGVLRALAALADQARTRAEWVDVLDRALVLIARHWPGWAASLGQAPVPPDLATAAALATLDLADRYAALGATDTGPLPEGLLGADLHLIESGWRLDPGLLPDALMRARRPDAAEDATAEALLGELAGAVDRGDPDEALRLARTLLSDHGHTTPVRGQAPNLRSLVQALESA